MLAGMQCHNARFTWKIVFEADQQLFEMLLSACTPGEERRWKEELTRLQQLAQRNQFQEDHILRPEEVSLLFLGLKSLGNVLGQHGTLARRLSIQRAATVGPKTVLSQVIIKHTHAPGEDFESDAANLTRISRSQSVFTTHRDTTLAPKRQERIEMEKQLAKVWTRDLLEYPAMLKTSRGEQMLRSGATSVMRKFSKASIASSFTAKRSTSFHSCSTSRYDAPTAISTATQNSDAGSITALPAASNFTVDRPGSMGRASLRKLAPPERTSSFQGSLSKKTKPPNSITLSLDLSGDFYDEKSGMASVKSPKSRWSNPFSMVRAISTDKMKGIFG
jgi:hypothetical protein